MLNEEPRRVHIQHLTLNIQHSSLPTPAFLVDRSIVERNCTRMRQKARESGVAFRPHDKTHKTVEIARMQHGGALGPISFSTMIETDFFTNAGFGDITYALPMAPAKLPRDAPLVPRIAPLSIAIE